MVNNILKIVETAFLSHLICLHLLNSGVYIIYLHITETINETSSLITKRWRKKKNFPEFNLVSLETGMCVFVSSYVACEAILLSTVLVLRL